MKNISILSFKTALVFITALISVTGLAKTKIQSKSLKAETLSVDISEKPQTGNLSFSSDSRIQINGDSTMRKFSATSTDLNLKAKALLKSDTETNLPWTPVELEMILPVNSLKSGEETLDDHMHENLKMDKFPEIRMKLSTLLVSAVDSKTQSTVTASGTLTVAGVTKPIELKVDLTKEGENLKIKGIKKLLMSDFGIVPPTMMLGALKTRDEIEINIDVICLLTSK